MVVLIPEGGEKGENVSEGEHMCVQTGRRTLLRHWGSFSVLGDLSLRTAAPHLHNTQCTKPSLCSCLGLSGTQQDPGAGAAVMGVSPRKAWAAKTQGTERAAVGCVLLVLTCRVVAKGRWLPVVVAGWLPLGEKRG